MSQTHQNEKSHASENVPSSISSHDIDPSSVEFNDMNVHCFLRIFAELPLQELMILRAVCRRWNQTITAEICAPKTSIELVFIDRYKDLSEREREIHEDRHQKDVRKRTEFLQLMYPEENAHWIECEELRLFNVESRDRARLNLFLAAIFPNIQSLFISTKRLEPADAQFITAWASQLTTLTLLFKQISSPKEFGKKLDQSVRNLVNLHIFNGEFYAIDNSFNSFLHSLAPILARLESFGLKANRLNTKLDILPLFGDNCHRLGLNCEYNDKFPDQFAAELRLNQADPRNLVNSLTHLTLCNFQDIRLLPLLFNNFNNLRYLAIDVEKPTERLEATPIKLSDLLPVELKNAKKLEELTILNVDLRLDYVAGAKIPENILTLKSLTLTSQYRHHPVPPYQRTLGWCERMGRMFPNLERLDLEFDSFWNKDKRSINEINGIPSTFKHLTSLIY